jgi:aminoglycoside 6'-N-acetyltransferase
MITWRRLAEEDLPLLRDWLSQPHVARWWNHDTTPEGVRRDFGPSVRGAEPGDDLVALLDGDPVGLVQRSRLADYPEELAAFQRIVDVPDGAAIIDYLIGDAGRVGCGLGPRLIQSAVDGVWVDFLDTPCVLVAVVAANRASWRALEKAGFARVAEGEMEPDNPIDDPLHYVYRLDRP